MTVKLFSRVGKGTPEYRKMMSTCTSVTKVILTEMGQATVFFDDGSHLVFPGIERIKRQHEPHTDPRRI